jgi:5-oxoprolinase (ATP-hydrolysing)
VRDVIAWTVGAVVRSSNYIIVAVDIICVMLQVMPMVKAVSRGYTTCADAYLTPVLMQYLASFSSGFDSGFDDVQTLFMQR